MRARPAPTDAAVSADSVAAPSATEKSGRPILAKRESVAVERFRRRALEETDGRARERRSLVDLARAAMIAVVVEGAPVRARMKSSISALPGPVSQAIGSPPSTKVTLATPPILSTAIGCGRLEIARQRADGTPAPAARPARRRRRRRRGNHRPPAGRAGAPAPRRRRSAPSVAPPAGAARSGRESRRCRRRAVDVARWREMPRPPRRGRAVDEGLRPRASTPGRAARSVSAGAFGQRLRAAAPLVVRIGPIAGRAEAARRVSPSVSISATSTPSSEVPLISPIARNPANACPFVEFCRTCYTTRHTHTTRPRRDRK